MLQPQSCAQSLAVAKLSWEQRPSAPGWGTWLRLLRPPPAGAEDGSVPAPWGQRAGPCPPAASASDGCVRCLLLTCWQPGWALRAVTRGCDAGLRGLQRCAPPSRAAEAAPPDAPCLGTASSVFPVCGRAGWSWSAAPGSSSAVLSQRSGSCAVDGLGCCPVALRGALLLGSSGLMLFTWGWAGERVLGVLGIPQPGPSTVLSLRPVLSLSPGSAAWAAVVSLVSCPQSSAGTGCVGPLASGTLQPCWHMDPGAGRRPSCPPGLLLAPVCCQGTENSWLRPCWEPHPSIPSHQGVLRRRSARASSTLGVWLAAAVSQTRAPLQSDSTFQPSWDGERSRPVLQAARPLVTNPSHLQAAGAATPAPAGSGGAEQLGSHSSDFFSVLGLRPELHTGEQPAVESSLALGLPSSTAVVQLLSAFC